MADEKSGGAVEKNCVGELVIWRGESPRIVICDSSELKSLESRRRAGLFSGPMARAEFPGIGALDMYNRLMAAVRHGRYDYGTYYAHEAECGCGFSRKYLNERGMVDIGNILLRLAAETGSN